MDVHDVGGCVLDDGHGVDGDWGQGNGGLNAVGSGVGVAGSARRAGVRTSASGTLGTAPLAAVVGGISAGSAVVAVVADAVPEDEVASAGRAEGSGAGTGGAWRAAVVAHSGSRVEVLA